MKKPLCVHDQLTIAAVATHKKETKRQRAERETETERQEGREGGKEREMLFY